MSAFNAKKNVGMASLQHSDNGDKSNHHEILRKEMVEFVKRELQCTLGSVPMPITMAILADQYSINHLCIILVYLQGKERVLAALGYLTEKDATNDGFVELIELQRKYQEIHGVMLDKEQPKENPPVVPTCQRTEKLYTNDVQLARKFGTKDDFEDEPLPSRKHHNFSFKYGDARPEQQDLPQEEIIPGLSSDNGISSTNGYTQGAPPKSNIGGRPRGNVEELEAIFSASKRNNLPRKPDQTNYLEKKNGWSSNLPQKKEFNNSNKTYTTRDNGNYTDGANSSDDDDDILEAGNKRLRNEKKKDFSVKPLGNTLKTEELLAKAGVRLDNSSAMPVSESESISAPVNFESNSNGDGWWQSKPAERRTEPGNNFLSRARDTSHASQPKTAHAEKYMRQVMENKNEGRARFWAGKLAEEENNTKASIVKPMARAAPGPIVPIKKSDDSESSWLKVKTSTQSEIKNGFGKYESDEEQAVPNGNDTNLQGGFGAMNGNSFKSRSPTRFTHRVPENSNNEPADYFSEKSSNKWEKPSEKSTKPAQYTRNFTSGNFFGGMRDVNPTAQNGKPKPVSGGSFFSKFKDQLPDNGVGSAYLVNHWLTKSRMSAFNAKKNVGMASLQHSDNGDKSNRHEILRKEMVEFVKRELQCCLGSVAMPITMAILVDQYRLDTGEDLRDIAPHLGFPTPDAMLQSEEFSDVVGCDYTEAALGSNATRDEKTLCYRVVPNNRTQHLIDAIVQSKEEREIQHKYRELSTRALMDNASVNTKVLEGKERVLAALGLLTEKDATNDGFVELIELQRKYQEIHGVMLDKEELRKYFPKTHMKKVFEYCMPDDIELGTRVEHSGSLFLRLKRPLEEILADLEEIRQHRHSSKPRQKPMTNGNNEESKPSSSGIVPLQPKENPPKKRSNVETIQSPDKLDEFLDRAMQPESGNEIFGKFVASEMDGLSPVNQVLAKQNISQLLTQLKLKELTPTQDSQHPFVSGNGMDYTGGYLWKIISGSIFPVVNLCIV
ncbi:hypothetical protein Ddc_02375 [Ditylenchus destructor]|nr:hypothetical protein Ddc_02375 [Ditylenchus destructor]